MSDQLRLFHVHQPVTLAYGMGVDSTAIIVEMINRQLPIDLILFANTHGEKPETYAYLPVIQEYLAAHSMPVIQVVEISRDSKHASLEEECLTNQTLPSLAFGMKSCSLKWKVGPQNKYCNNWAPARTAWASGLKVQKIIGYDCSPKDSKRGTFGQDGTGKGKCLCCRSNPCKKYVYRYPLMEWGIDRNGCKDIIRAAGLPIPPKSACFFCPASHKDEIIWLREEHPDLYQRAIAIEETWLNGKHEKKSTKGLGRRFKWSEVES